MKNTSFTSLLFMTLVNTITHPITNIEYFRNGMESIHEYPTCFYGDMNDVGFLGYQIVSADLETGTLHLRMVAEGASSKLMIGEILNDFGIGGVVSHRIESIEPNADPRYINVVVSVVNPNDEVRYTYSSFFGGLTHSIESIDQDTGVVRIYVFNGEGDGLKVGDISDGIVSEQCRIESIEPTHEDSTALVTLSPVNHK